MTARQIASLLGLLLGSWLIIGVGFYLTARLWSWAV